MLQRIDFPAKRLFYSDKRGSCFPLNKYPAGRVSNVLAIKSRRQKPLFMSEFTECALKSRYLEVKDDCPDQTENYGRASIYDVCGIDVDQLDL